MKCIFGTAFKLALFASIYAVQSMAGTFGQAVVIGGQTADIALDEGRGVLYAANFTANRIEVMSLESGAIQTSFNVSPQPGALALSPDRRWLLVAHYGNFAAPNQPRNALTLINLESNQRQTFTLSSVPLSLAFGTDGMALVVTSNAFLQFDPLTGTLRTLLSIGDLAVKTLPVQSNNFPQNIVASSSVATPDSTKIFGAIQASASDNQVLLYRYDVTTALFVSQWTFSPPVGPRGISVNASGTNFMVGYALFNDKILTLAQFPNASGLLNIGGHVFDSANGIIYAQVDQAIPAAATPTTGTTPVTPAPAPASVDQVRYLQILDADNLNLREQVRLSESIRGRMILSSNAQTIYAASDSGVMILPVGKLHEYHKVVANVEDVVFRGNFCDRRVATQQFVIADASGKNTDFVISGIPAGVNVEPIAGVTPAVITVSVDPISFSSKRGTVAQTLTIASDGAVNPSVKVRLLINSREPDQRGTNINLPGKLVDILSDPTRDRFFVLRQDTNSVLVFDGNSYQQVGALRTGNTPTQMAISFDRKYLLVGNDNSQLVNVYSLDTLQQLAPIMMPSGHYPRSVASAAGTTLAASRVAGPKHRISRLDLSSRSGTELPTLDVFENDINVNTVLIPSPNGAKIFGASADGTTFLFDGNSNSFVTTRKDATALTGSYAASAFDQFVVGNFLLNGSLVPTKRLAPDTQPTYGFAFVDNTGFRLTTSATDGPGTIQRVAFPSATAQIGTRTIESPVQSDVNQPFIRTVAPLYTRNTIVLLTVSGITILPWNYDAAVATPRITKVTNLADGSGAVAPGSLVKIEGTDLSPVNQASRERPLPTALGESCITVNGLPIPLILVSVNEINAQLPYEVIGNTTLILRTPGGVSDNFNLLVNSSAPSIFRTSIEGIDGEVATIVNGRNGLLVTGSNPVKRNDTITIYLAGLGKTNPAIEAGLSAPLDPLAKSLVEPQVTLGGTALPIVFSGLTPGEVGVYQINALVPRWVPTGFSLPLVINSSGFSTTLSVRVIE